MLSFKSGHLEHVWTSWFALEDPQGHPPPRFMWVWLKMPISPMYLNYKLGKLKIKCYDEGHSIEYYSSLRWLSFKVHMESKLNPWD